MTRALLPAVLGVVFVTAGCGSDDDGSGGHAPLSRTQVEQRVAAEAPDTDGSGVKASCVERDEDRTYRCEVTDDSITSAYTVFVSKDGKRVQLRQE